VNGFVEFFQSPLMVLVVALVLGGFGVVLLVPHTWRRWRILGWASAAASAFLLGASLPALDGGVRQALFWLGSGATAAAALATISFRSPAYSALAFAATLLGTASLFLLQGAQFLAVATVIVYAGAIVVTFLFVLMLAQPQGHAPYDRISWGRLPIVLAAGVGIVAVGGVMHLTARSLSSIPSSSSIPSISSISSIDSSRAESAASATTAPSAAGYDQPNEHVARLGGQLFSIHLVSLEVAGTLLLAALVGAVAMLIQARSASDEPSAEDAAASEGGADA
jgi:NADH-quinone oxidoreductase subunit J